MKYDFENIADSNNVGSVKNHAKMIRKFFKLNYYEDSISLWVSEMDFRMAPELEQAIVKRVQKGVLGYSTENDEYFSSVVEWLEYKHQVDAKPEWIVSSPGTIHGLKNVLKAFTNEGDKIIIQPPVYGQFKSKIEETKRVVAVNPLINTGDGFKIDFDNFEILAQKEDVKMFILCNPHNPTGNVWTEEEIVRLLDIASKNNLIVFSDEVHGEIIREGVKFHSSARYSYDNLITAFGLGKAFNITGMHITNLVIQNEQLRSQLMEYTGFSTSSPIAMVAISAAYNNAREWLKEVNKVIDQNLIFIDKYIKENMPLVKYRIPEGTYLAWFDFSAYKVSTKELTKKMADGKILMESGLAFGKQGKGFIRMMAATPRARLEEALRRIQKVLESLD